MITINLRTEFSTILFENFYNKLIRPTFKNIPNECPPESEFLDGLLPAVTKNPNAPVCHVILVYPNINELPKNPAQRLTVLESDENEVAACVAVKYFPNSNCALMKNLIIKQEYRGQKYAQLLVNEAHRSILTEAKAAGKTGKKSISRFIIDLNGYFIETMNTANPAIDEENSDANIRLGLWRRMGFFVVDVKYAQPTLPGKRAAADNMNLMVYRDYMKGPGEILHASSTKSLEVPETATMKRRISTEISAKGFQKEILIEFINELYASILGKDNYANDNNYRKIMRQLDMSQSPMIPVQNEIKQCW